MCCYCICIILKADLISCKFQQTNKGSVFYAVAHGHKTGVFKTWEECQEATKDFKGAKFKKFDNEEDAKLFVEGRNIKETGNCLESFMIRDLSKISFTSLFANVAGDG